MLGSTGFIEEDAPSLLLIYSAIEPSFCLCIYLASLDESPSRSLSSNFFFVPHIHSRRYFDSASRVTIFLSKNFILGKSRK